MNTSRDSVCTAFLVAVCAVVTLGGCDGFGAGVTDLGEFTLPRDINDAGVVVGTRFIADEGQQGFVYEDGQFSTIDVPGGQAVAISAINESGQMIGLAKLEGEPCEQAFFYDPDLGVQFLGTLGGSRSAPANINESGQVVGKSETEPASGLLSCGGFYSVDIEPWTTTHAFLWHDGDMTDLGTLGGTDSGAEAINDHGVIVGGADGPADHLRPFRWENGEMTDLGTLGSDEGGAWDINNAGQIVGWVRTDEDLLRPVMWENGQIVDLGAEEGLTSAAGNINESGVILGVREHGRSEMITHWGITFEAPYNTDAVIWRNGEVLNLNDLFPGVGGSGLVNGNAINNNGQIIAMADFCGVPWLYCDPHIGRPQAYLLELPP